MLWKFCSCVIYSIVLFGQWNWRQGEESTERNSEMKTMATPRKFENFFPYLTSRRARLGTDNTRWLHPTTRRRLMLKTLLQALWLRWFILFFLFLTFLLWRKNPWFCFFVTVMTSAWPAWSKDDGSFFLSEATDTSRTFILHGEWRFFFQEFFKKKATRVILFYNLLKQCLVPCYF